MVKLLQACEYAQLLLNLVVEHYSKFSIINVIQPFMDGLNKMLICNINKLSKDNGFFFIIFFKNFHSV